MPLAVSRTLVEDKTLSIEAKMPLPIRRTMGIRLFSFSRQPRTTSAFSAISVSHSGPKNLGSHVPSASRNPSRSASDRSHASLMAAPYPRLYGKTIR